VKFIRRDFEKPFLIFVKLVLW